MDDMGNWLARMDAPHEGQALAKPAQAGNAGSLDPYEIARRALRGRWGWAVALALLTGAAGALFGWRAGKPVYRSEGLIRIAYTVPRVMRQDAQEQVPVEIFQAFVQSQQAVLTSRRVVDQALLDPAWRKTGRGASAAVIQDFAENLKAESKPGSDLLTVTYTDTNPNVAAAAVKSIIHAYQALYSGENSQIQQEQLQALEKRRRELQADLDAAQAQSRAVSGEIGFTNAETLYNNAVVRVTRLSSMLEDIRVAMELSKGQVRTPAPVVTADTTMREYIASRDALENKLRALEAAGYGEKHPLVVETRSLLQLANQRVERYGRQLQAQQAALASQGAAAGSANGGLSGAAALVGLPPEVLKSSEQSISKLYEQARAEMIDLGNKRLQLENLKASADKMNRDLADVTQHMQTLQVEAGLSGRLNVITTGEVPTAPFQDRRIQLAGVGGAGGAAVPVGLLVLMGLMGRRYRYSDETSDLSSRLPLLGILPALPEHLDDLERAADAAQCIHQVRVMLQVGNRGEGSPAYLLTSASPSEGKTSLTAALGMSFAASGSRVLLIDCDMVGRRLTHGFEAEDLSGLHEALAGGSLKDHVRKTATAGLWVLPAGRGDVLQAGTIAPRAMTRLLKEAREMFDVILIDSGPVLGSVEVSALAPLADGTVMVIARRQQRPMVERAVRHLESVGAKLAGMVFNRAESKDFNRSVSCSSLRSERAQQDVQRATVLRGSRHSRLGPVVGCVALLLPAGEEPENGGK